MKKPVFLLVAFFFCAAANSQITITTDDMPSVGDTIRTSTTVNLGGIDYEQTGSGFTWDFSALVPLNQQLDTFVSVQSVPLAYWLVFLTAANLAHTMPEFEQIPGFQVTDVFDFYKNSPADYRMVGYGVTLNGLPIPLKFENPDIMYRFPLDYGHVDSSFSDYEIAVPGMGYLGGWKKRYNEADGWGTLITPFGSFETLRLRSDVIQFDSLYIDSLGFGMPLMREFIEYKWMGKGWGLPLCQVTDDGLAPVIAYIDSVRNLNPVTAASVVSGNNDLQLFPNPAFDDLWIRGTFHNSVITVMITDPSGRIVMYETLPVHGDGIPLRISLKDITPGLYLLGIRDGDQWHWSKVMVK
ncbi:MAG: T9SS type A sorting domain-containing protein [Bacteroidales bacterium]|nr:T9SS type A sorting domain-containing protein [Bacteroidales bacterium]